LLLVQTAQTSTLLQLDKSSTLTQQQAMFKEPMVQPALQSSPIYNHPEKLQVRLKLAKSLIQLRQQKLPLTQKLAQLLVYANRLRLLVITKLAMLQ
jgi:hypothetical protein